MEALGELGVIAAAATLGGALFERVGLPAIPAFLLAGAAVGPGGLGLAGEPGPLATVAELGVVFLLFEIGLELPLEAVRRLWRDALLAGGAQMAVTIASVAAIAVSLGLRPSEALAIGGLVALSSTAVVMRSLAARRQTDAPQGRVALAILLFQDLCLVPMLLGVPILAGVVPPSVAALGAAAGKAIAALFVLFVGARFVFPWLLDRVAVLRSSELFSLVAFLLVVGAAVGAEQLGLTHAVGAFSAGLVLAASPYAHQLQAEVAPLRGVLLGVFFTSIGMLFDPAVALHLAPEIGAYVAAVVLLKAAVVAGVLTTIGGHGRRVAVLVALALAQTGEFSFVLADQVRRAGLLGDALWQVFLAGSIATLVATPLVIGAAPALAQRLGGGPGRPAEPSGGPALRGHVAIAGFGHTGRTIARVLRSGGIPYAVVDANPRGVAEARARGEPVLYGDVTQPRILESMGLPQARLLVVALSDPVAVRRVVALARERAPSLPIVVRAQYVAEVDELYARGASVVVASEYEASLDLLVAVLRGVGVPHEAAHRLADGMREEGYEALRPGAAGLLDPWLADLFRAVATHWIEVPAGPAVGRTIGELAIRTRSGVSVLALRRAGVVRPAPGADERLAAGDALLVSVDAESTRRLHALLAGEADPGADARPV